MISYFPGTRDELRDEGAAVPRGTGRRNLRLRAAVQPKELLARLLARRRVRNSG